MNLHQLYQKQVEAWKELGKKNDSAKCGHREPRGLTANDYDCSDIHIGYAEAMSDLLSSRHKDTIELIVAEIERKKGMRKASHWDSVNQRDGICPDDGYCRECQKKDSYNSAIDEDIAYLEEQLRKLKNERGIKRHRET